MKRVFGTMEAVFDVFYLTGGCVLGLILLITAKENAPRLLAGIMALILVGGDSFHLFPRIAVIRTGSEEAYRESLGRGKQVTSMTMTVVYLLLWQIGVLVYAPIHIRLWSSVVCALAAVRIVLCLLPQNKWLERYPPVFWGILRNIPFFLQGLIVAGLFFTHRSIHPGLRMMWMAIALSFLFYLPVVVWANRNPKIGMLMLPKTCAYVWMLVMCLSL